MSLKNNQKIGLGIAGGLAGLVGIGWVGLQMAPPPVSLPTGPDWQVTAHVLPEKKLPPPVFRHYKLIMGMRYPNVRTAVIGAQARFRRGLWIPMRFVAYHIIGQHFLRDMEVTWFGYTLFSAEDTYINGRGVMNIAGRVDKGPEVDQGAAMAMWAEQAILFPTATIDRPGVRWEGIDEHTARLVYPFGEGEDGGTVTFDPDTGFARQFTGMRHKGVGGAKEPWHVYFNQWRKYKSMLLPQQIEVMWEKEGQPWFKATLTGESLNVDLTERFPAG